MTKTANVETDGDGKIKIHRGVFDMSPDFDRALEHYCTDSDATRTSVLRRAVAEFIGYEGETITLVDRTVSAAAAGLKRSKTMQATKKSASVLDQIKARLLAGGDLDMDDLKALILGG